MFADAYQKVTAKHLERDAFLYIRQSTLRQVFENTESTKRQYALRDRAVALGWPIERIHVIDSDLGHSGAESSHREGFQKLVSAVAMGQAGIVMGLEVSRLARNCSDWHRLIEIAALGGALILDEDGIYDPAHFNDRLLLGLKGTMSEAELHLIKARMQGGILNKARRGELEMCPPIGLIYGENGQIGLDPDPQIQGALRLLFTSFQREGSAMVVLKCFRDQKLLFPRRLRHGASKGEVLWGDLNHSRVIQILHNPRYAGAFVYGRTKTVQTLEGRSSQRRLPRETWQVVIPNVHCGYIGWEQYEANQRRLAANALGFGAERKGGPPREGPALLQGRVLCGICGARMGIHYESEGGERTVVYMCQEDLVRRAGQRCQRIPGKGVDEAVGKLLLETVGPASLEVALAVAREIEVRLQDADRLRAQQVERSRYEAELARRRYLKVDPDNRLVADALEADWNDKLRSLSRLQQEYEQARESNQRVLDHEARERIMALAQDFPRIWNDPRTAHREKKRMAGLLIEDVTLIRSGDISAHIRFRGGQARTLVIPLPLPIAQIRKTKPKVITEVDRLLDAHCDREVAEILNQQGCRTWQNEPFNLKKIAWIREAFGLESRFGRLRARGLLTAVEIQKQLGVSKYTVHAWGRKGILRKHQYGNKNRCLYEPLGELIPVKGRGGIPPSFRSITQSPV